MRNRTEELPIPSRKCDAAPPLDFSLHTPLGQLVLLGRSSVRQPAFLPKEDADSDGETSRCQQQQRENPHVSLTISQLEGGNPYELPGGKFRVATVAPPRWTLTRERILEGMAIMGWMCMMMSACLVLGLIARSFCIEKESPLPLLAELLNWGPFRTLFILFALNESLRIIALHTSALPELIRDIALIVKLAFLLAALGFITLMREHTGTIVWVLILSVSLQELCDLGQIIIRYESHPFLDPQLPPIILSRAPSPRPIPDTKNA